MSLTVMQSFVLPALSGACIGLIGVAYRLGQRRGLSPLEILGTCCVLGAVTFSVSLFRSGAHLADMPLSLWAWGLVAGLGQYAAVKLFGSALRLGPLAPVWCVVSLNFVPTMVYSAMFLSEHLVALQYAAVAAAVLCVVVASMQPGTANQEKARPGDQEQQLQTGREEEEENDRQGDKETRRHGATAATMEKQHLQSGSRLRRQGLYLAMLVGIFMVGSLLSIALRDVGARQAAVGELVSRQHSHFLLLQCYVVLMACTAAEMWLAGRRVVSVKALAALGLLAGIGSVGGLAILSQCSTSGMAFAISGIAQILFVAVISVLAFGEKTTASWYGTITLGVLAVALANWREMIGG